MPKTTKSGSAKKSELPSTLRKSPPKAQRTFAKAHDSAVKQYGEGERAHRVAYDALKHSFERSAITGSPKLKRDRPIRGRAAADPTPRASLRKASTPTHRRNTLWKSRGGWIFRAARP